jgi:hypothetical protein
MSIVREATLPSPEIESLESAVEAFLLGARRLKVSGAGPLLDTFSSASLHCRVHHETYRSAVELTRGAERVEMPAEMKARLRSLLLEGLRRGRS